MKNYLRNPFVRKALYVLLGLIVLLILLDNVIMPWYVSSAETTVPKVIGMNEEEAISLLEGNGFETMISDTSYGLDYPKGVIFLQKPDAGRVVKRGRTVYLFLSGGEKVVYVPSLKGKSIVDAKFSLERIGLKLGRVERVPSGQPEDMIFDQQFEAGTSLKQGRVVGVTVSAGRGGGSIIVPDLIGKSMTDAKLILSDSSLTVGKINYQPSATLLPNTILDQFPSGGNKINAGDPVDLFVTKSGDQINPDEGGE
jgi:serine/threonine-protein kinase